MSGSMAPVATSPRSDTVKSLREVHAEATRAALLAAGRELFAERGYAGVSIEDIARRASVTSGALYHHFGAKKSLFDAVCEQVQREVAEQVFAAVGEETDPWRRLTHGCQVFLDLTLAHEVQQIVSIDAPSVLGAARRHEFDAKYGIGLLQQGLADALETVPSDPAIEPLARLLLGALMEASASLVGIRNPRSRRKEIGQALDRLLAGLR